MRGASYVSRENASLGRIKKRVEASCATKERQEQGRGRQQVGILGAKISTDILEDELHEKRNCFLSSFPSLFVITSTASTYRSQRRKRIVPLSLLSLASTFIVGASNEERIGTRGDLSTHNLEVRWRVYELKESEDELATSNPKGPTFG